jgi:Ca2+-binding RTX toxin-like protein
MSLLGDLLGGVDNTLNAFVGNQTVTGGAGDDLINSLLGNNVLNGGAGSDIVDYANQAGPIIANLALGTVSNVDHTTSDSLNSIESVIGSDFGDTLIGGSGNFLEGGQGDDLLQSLVGGNTLDGGAGVDTVSFLGQTVGEVASLLTGTATGLDSDVMANVENLTGTDLGDTLTGDLTDNVLDGGLGDDILSAGGGGLDTLVGGLGVDTADLSDVLAPVTANLALGTVVGSGVDFVLSGIEGATGSTGDDTLIGDDGANSLDGGSGDDTIDGSQGDDTLNGGTGTDTVTYADAPSGVTVDLQTDRSTGGGGNDTLASIENVIGSNSNDTLSGDSFANHLEGGGGDDVLNGRGAADTLDGGSGNDTVNYADAGGAVSVNLATGTTTGGSGSDTLVSIENATGSAFNDTLTGDAGANSLSGLGGNDTLQGGAGNDTIDGGTGVDTASYATAASAVLVNLTAGVSSGGGGADTLTAIENAMGSNFNDAIYGDANANVLSGGGGDDYLTGRGNGDTLDGGSGSDIASYRDASAAVSVDLVAGVATGGGGNDTLISIEDIYGSRFADTLTGNAAGNEVHGFGGDDLIVGAAGNDVIYGGAGHDTVSYADATSKVVVDLDGAFAKGGAGHDALHNIENVVGSDFNDVLTGSHKHNVLDGGAGNDKITGGVGSDVLTGGDGADRFIFTSVADSAKHGGYDLITDLQAADFIDLSKIDADTTTSGNQAFHVVDQFSHHAGEMTVTFNAKFGVSTVSLDVDGDGKADSAIHITGDATSFDHFIL